MMTEKTCGNLRGQVWPRALKKAVTESRERTAEQLFDHLESVALAVEGNDLGTTEDPFEPTKDASMTPRRGSWSTSVQ